MATAIIADDEPLLLVELKDLLADAWPALQIVAQARTGSEALRMIGELQPDVAFLDIEMPRMSGLEVAAVAKPTHVVFVTAYDRYAVEAFEHGAADYLLKPLTPARIALAVQRLKAMLAPADAASLRFVQAWVGSAMRVVPIEEVVAFISDDKHTRVVTARGDLLLRRSLVELMRELDPSLFWPVARGTVIHARYIQEVRRSSDEGLHLRMVGVATPIMIGQRYRERFRGM
ncbi:MAG TPA: LytTR family DNA-binding domain-containing protein [Burkholderiaceae bacterium]